MAVTEVSEPSPQGGHDRFDHLRETGAPGWACLFSNPLLKASDGLGSDPPPWCSFAGEAESEKLPLPGSGYGAFRLIHLELEAVRDKACTTLPHSLSRSFAAPVNVAVVGLAHEAMTTPLSLLVQFVQPQIAEPR